MAPMAAADETSELNHNGTVAIEATPKALMLIMDGGKRIGKKEKKWYFKY